MLAIILLLEGCDGDSDKPFRRESTAMDTFVTITIFDPGISREVANALVDSAFNEIARVEAIATDYSDSSEIGRINLMSGTAPLSASEEIVGLIRESFSYSIMSGGSFDITVGPLVHRWNFLSDHPTVPSDAELKGLLPLVGYKLVSLIGTRIFLPVKGMKLDLGAIGKGYAVDRAISILKRYGVKQVIVDLGGNLGVAWQGTRMFDSTRAKIFIRHPRHEGEMFGHFDVGTAGVSTSGDYQRFFVQDGIRYHHILDPKTGYPARDVVSVTIVAANATRADALSTTAFVLGRVEGMKLIEDLPDVEGFMVYEAGDTLGYLVSSGLRNRFVREDSR